MPGCTRGTKRVACTPLHQRSTQQRYIQMATANKATVQVQGYTLTGTVPTAPYKANSARAAYWAWLVANIPAGKAVPVATLKAAQLAAPPSTPTHGKLAGKPEPLAGWLAWFAKAGLGKYVQVKVPAA